MASAREHLTDRAIADFLSAGGRVARVKESIGVAESELLAYLTSCGMKVQYSPGGGRDYLYGGRRFTRSGLVALANERRVALGLSPVALRVAIVYSGRGAIRPKGQ